MTADIFTKGDIKIRRLKSGRCVREDEWKQFVKFNEVRLPHIPDEMRLTPV